MKLAWILVCCSAGCLSTSTPWEPVAHELREDVLVVRVAGSVFTEYHFAKDRKYPYFFPVNGPFTIDSVTTESSEPYPHHHSLFFACDRVNGGNYWQEGLERGQIVQESLEILDSAEDHVTFRTTNRWVRQGAPSPFLDERTITVSGPSFDLRVIDFSIRLQALEDVTIEKSNHALFAARLDPELAVKGGGTMVDAEGRRDEKETFGQPSAWMDCGGWRGGVFEGIAILNHPSNPWSPPPWFTRDYGFFSPSPMNWLDAPFRLAQGEELRLRYRVIVHRGTAQAAGIGGIYERWVREM